MSIAIVAMATYWAPDLPDIESFAGRLWHSILIFANGASFARSSKQINMLGCVCGLVKCFLNTESAKIMKSDWWDWKRVSCCGNQIFYCRCVACRTTPFAVHFQKISIHLCPNLFHYGGQYTLINTSMTLARKKRSRITFA